MTLHATAHRKVVGAAVAALALVGVLAGCSSHPGAAAVVDGRTIPASDVVSAVSDLKPAVPSVTSAQVLNILIEGPTVVQLASDKGHGVSPEEAKAAVDAFFTAAQVTPPASYSAATLEIGYLKAAVGKLNADTADATVTQEYQDRLGKLHVTVNPRFGSWADAQLGDPLAPSWMVPGQ